jgi:replicative DNA helicase
MPAIPGNIHLPNTPRFRPWTLGEAAQGFEREMLSGNLELYRTTPLGIPWIDGCLGGGAHAGDLILLGGMQNVGKTILGLQAALSMALRREALPIFVCYEHDVFTLWLRLLSHASVDDPAAAQPTGIRRSEIEQAVLDHYAGHLAAAGSTVPPDRLDLQWMIERLPTAERAWWRVSECLDRLWLVFGDSVETTIEYLEGYVRLARHYGFHRAVLIVDYAQRIPLSPLQARGLNVSERIEQVIRGLKSLALREQLPILAVAAADSEGLRRQRIHVENLWGPATVQYEPDVALILNRDSLDDVAGERWVRVAIEKNRHGPSEVEYRHRLHGAFYTLSPDGQRVEPEESYQAERVALQPPRRPRASRSAVRAG